MCHCCFCVPRSVQIGYVSSWQADRSAVSIDRVDVKYLKMYKVLYKSQSTVRAFVIREAMEHGE